ncbi:MAG: hypothetical protein AMXMBFR84_30410 [Candidatus Hydrogenedentota bacterium]
MNIGKSGVRKFPPYRWIAVSAGSGIVLGFAAETQRANAVGNGIIFGVGLAVLWSVMFWLFRSRVTSALDDSYLVVIPVLRVAVCVATNGLGFWTFAWVLR